MSIRRTSRAVLFILLLITLPLVSGCSSAYERSEKPAGDWSRGLLLGESNIKQAVTLQVDREKQVHVVWIEPLPDEAQGLHYVRIDRAGQVSVDGMLPINLPQPRNPQLLVDASDRLHLTFLSRSDEGQALYHARIDAAGETSEPTRLSKGGDNVDSFHTVLSPEGTIHVLWAGDPANGEPGIYETVLQGADTGSPSLLVPEGSDPFLLIDSSSGVGSATMHLVWTVRTGFSSREIYYATLEDGELTPPAGHHVTTFDFPESATYQPPVIGLDTQKVYLIWSVQNMGGGLTPTAADTYYVSFPPGEPQTTEAQNLELPLEHRPDYDGHSSPYRVHELAFLSPDVYSTDFINAPAVVGTKKGELPVVVSLIIESASKQFMQLALTVLSDGQPIGYQLANETSNASVLPTLAADQEGDLHLAWLDTAGFRRYKVYYATTAPEAKAWLDRTTLEDVGRRAASLTWGVLSAIGFLPLTLMWNAPALVWLVLFYLFARQEHLDELGAKIALAVSFVIYLAVKMLFLPGLLSAGTPFVHMVPQELAPMLTTIIPGAILLVALVGLIIYLRRSHDGVPPSLFKAYLVFALLDSGLTAILYAPRFFDPRG